MTNKISEIQIVPIKPRLGLLAFASVVLNDSFYLGSMGIQTRPSGQLRLTYPTKKVGDKPFPIYNPIKKDIADFIEAAVIAKFEEIQGNQ